jgi:hypothetical protein
LPHRHRHHSKYRDLPWRHGEFVRAAGVPIAFAAEVDRVPANIDHFWITLSVGTGEPIRIALSTHSRQNAAAGFDPRVRVGIVPSTWSELPPAGMAGCRGLDYHEIEMAEPVVYLEYERPALERLLTQKTERALLIEAWGELYIRNHLGLHQIHSRRASCSVLQDYQGRDGAIRFYYGDNATTEMLLFKYCGQP